MVDSCHIRSRTQKGEEEIDRRRANDSSGRSNNNRPSEREVLFKSHEALE